jgi:sugar phosphate isomerase/epimerase
MAWTGVAGVVHWKSVGPVGYSAIGRQPDDGVFRWAGCWNCCFNGNETVMPPLDKMSHSSPSRRDFFRAVAASGAALSVPALLSGQAAAAEPPARTGTSFMKLSLAAYSFNRQLGRGGKPGEMDLMDFIDFCAKMDLHGTELTGYYFPQEVTHEYLMQVKQKTFLLGLDISGTAIGNDFCLPEGPEREQQLAMTRQWIDHAAAMGAPVIRIFAGRVPRGDSEEAAVARCVEGINESLAYAAQKGVFLALENHGGITATPEQMLAIIEQVDDSPWFGVNFDSGNFHTEDPYGDLEKIAPYTITAQIKVAMSTPEGKQPADLKRVIDILKAVHYRGYIVLEYEEPEDPRSEIPKYLDQLRELIA